MIDDDAILDYDCMEKMDPSNAINKSEAYACVVMSHGNVDLEHRRNQNGKVSHVRNMGRRSLCANMRPFAA